jgi:hypothetical protein
MPGSENKPSGLETMNDLDFGIESTMEYEKAAFIDDFLDGKAPTDSSELEEVDAEGEGKEDTPVPKGKGKETKTPTKTSDKNKEKEKVEDKKVDTEKEREDLLENFLDEDDQEDQSKGKSKEKETEGTEDETEEEDDNESDEQVFSDFAKDLFKQGILSLEDEETIDGVTGSIKDAESLKKRFEQEKKNSATMIVESFLERHGEEYRDMFDAIFVNGVNPKDYLESYVAVEDVSKLDMSKKENQEKVYRQYYRAFGWDAEKIEKKLQKTIDYGDLEDESKDLQGEIVKLESKKVAELAERKQQEISRRQQMDEEFDQNITNVLKQKTKEGSFDGIPLTPKKAEAAYDFLYTKRYKTPSGDLLTEFDKFFLDLKHPDKHPLKVKIALLAMNGFTLDDIKKEAISNENSDLFSSLRRRTKGERKVATKNAGDFFPSF